MKLREEWPVLEDAFTSEYSRKRILELNHWQDILPPLSNHAADKRNLQTAIDVHSDGEELLPSHRDLDGRLIVAQLSLAEMTATAAAVDEPGFTPASVPRLGGVDPLGLRQINFDLMDQVFPGLNNVARHIRPFVLVAWAWRRANQLAKSQGTKNILLDHLQDFVDRIEVIYVWSQFLRTPDADLPGRPGSCQSPASPAMDFWRVRLAAAAKQSDGTRRH